MDKKTADKLYVCNCCMEPVKKLVKTPHGMMCETCAAERKASLDKINKAWGGAK